MNVHLMTIHLVRLVLAMFQSGAKCYTKQQHRPQTFQQHFPPQRDDNSMTRITNHSLAAGSGKQEEQWQ